MELPPRQPPQQNHHEHHRRQQGNGHDDALPAKLRVLVDFARHQEETIKTLEERLHARDEEILWHQKQVKEFKALLLKNENRTVLLLEQLSL